MLGWILRCPAPPGHLHPIPDGPHRIDGRTHVQDGEPVGVFIDVPVVVVNDIADFLSATIYNPIMSVERQFISTERVSREKSSTLQCIKQHEKDPLGFTFISHPIQWRILALGENSLALPPNLFRDGPHGHSLPETNMCLKLTVV